MSPSSLSVSLVVTWFFLCLCPDSSVLIKVSDYGAAHLVRLLFILNDCIHKDTISFFFFFLLFGAPPAAYGGSQARGLIRATAASLHRSHSNTRSEPCLRPAPQLMATPDP